MSATLGATGVGKPWLKAEGAPIVAQSGFWPVVWSRLVSICTAMLDWQAGLNTEVNGAFFRSALEV